MHRARLASSIWACCAGVRLGGGVDGDDAEVVGDGESGGLAAEDGEGGAIDALGNVLICLGETLAARTEPCCFETCVVGFLGFAAGAGVAFRADAEEAFDVLTDFGFGPDAAEPSRALAVVADVAVERVIERFAEEERGFVRVLEAVTAADHGHSPSQTRLQRG